MKTLQVRCVQFFTILITTISLAVFTAGCGGGGGGGGGTQITNLPENPGGGGGVLGADLGEIELGGDIVGVLPGGGGIGASKILRNADRLLSPDMNQDQNGDGNQDIVSLSGENLQTLTFQDIGDTLTLSLIHI